MATKTASSKPAKSSAFKQKVRGVVSSLIEQHFRGTLGSEPNIVDYVMGLIQAESSFRPSALGLTVSEMATTKQKQGSSRARQYMDSDPVEKILATGDPAQRKNIQSGKVAQGLMQVMGWNIVRGGSSRAKRCEIEETRRPDLAQSICVNAGDSIEAKLLGEANIQNNIMAGLLILETKYLTCRRKSGGWSAGGAVFQSRLAAAVGAYLGVGGVDLRTNLTAEQYVERILGGESFRIANGRQAGGGDIAVRTSQASSSGPETNGSDVPATIPGCA